MDKEPRQRIEITHLEAQALIQRGKEKCFDKQDYAVAVAIIGNYFALDHAYQEKSHAMQRLLNRFFSRTEKAKAVLKNASAPETAPRTPKVTEGEPTKEKPKGHGRNGAADMRRPQSAGASARLPGGRSMPALSQGQALLSGGAGGGGPDRGPSALGGHCL